MNVQETVGWWLINESDSTELTYSAVIREPETDDMAVVFLRAARVNMAGFNELQTDAEVLNEFQENPPSLEERVEAMERIVTGLWNREWPSLKP